MSQNPLILSETSLNWLFCYKRRVLEHNFQWFCCSLSFWEVTKFFVEVLTSTFGRQTSSKCESRSGAAIASTDAQQEASKTAAFQHALAGFFAGVRILAAVELSRQWNGSKNVTRIRVSSSRTAPHTDAATCSRRQTLSEKLERLSSLHWSSSN